MSTNVQAGGRPIDPNSKNQRALAIFNQMSTAGKPRRDVIKAFVDDVGLTPSGAATYYQNFKRSAVK